MEINLDGKFKLRFDPNEVRVNIDGEKIDVGARMSETNDVMVREDIYKSGKSVTIDAEKNTIKDYDVKFRSIQGNEESDVVDFLDDNTLYFDNETGATALGAYFKQKYLKWKTKSESVKEDSPTQK